MKQRMVALSFLLLALAALPVEADDIYDNGPTNGQTNAWQINFGHIVSDSFMVSGDGATIDGLRFSAWMLPYQTVLDVEISITSSEFGGTTYFDGYVNLMTGGCSINQLGWKVCDETGFFSSINLAPGTYWLNLQNGQSGLDDPAYWDENSGPSLASESSAGTIPSESFTILGSAGGTTTTTGTTPEPSSIVLFGSGIVGLAGMMRRRF